MYRVYYVPVMITDISAVRQTLFDRLETLEDKAALLRSPELRALFNAIREQAPDQRAAYGQAVNALKNELETVIAATAIPTKTQAPIDVTAPWDTNATLPAFIATTHGSIHPLSQEIALITDIFGRMGFQTKESREIDDQYHMFESLNFPKGHPARDDYDTFMTVEKDAAGDSFIAPAHTSTMQNRTLVEQRDKLEAGEAIAVIVTDRVFRNEDLDARHEHTFYQVEGIYVARGVHSGMLIATLQTFLESYYGTKLEVRVNPFYFPFTEPSFEFALSCPFCNSKADNNGQTENLNCKVCSGEGWIELLGCGMIHPNVLKAADIDPNEYTGFAFGCGIDRLVMMKYGIEDVRHFESGRLDFLEQFK